MVSRVIKLIDTESILAMVLARGWGDGERGSHCLMGTEFGKVKSSENL